MRCLKKELPSQKQCLWFESVDELIKEIEKTFTGTENAGLYYDASKLCSF